MLQRLHEINEALEIPALKQLQTQIQNILDRMASQPGNSLLTQAALELATGLNQFLLPTTVVDLIPVGKAGMLLEKLGVKELSTLEKAAVKFDKAKPEEASKLVDAGIEWGRGIQKQGMPWESYLEKQLPAGSRLPPNFATFDFFDDVSGRAISAKTMDTLTEAKLAKPEQIYYSLKGNIDKASRFERASLSGVTLESGDIASREIQLAVPGATTAEQWQQIQRAVQYGLDNGVKLIVTQVRQ